MVDTSVVVDSSEAVASQPVVMALMVVRVGRKAMFARVDYLGPWDLALVVVA